MPTTALARRATAFAASSGLRSTDSPTVSAVLASPAFQDALSSLAATGDRAYGEVLAEATAALQGMAASHDRRIGRLWDRFGEWMRRGYDVLADEDGLARLRRLDRSHSLVFLISHRSYLDEFVLPPTLNRGGLSPLFGIAGGNLDFFPLGDLARRNGIVHVRRDTSDAPVYRLALRSFIARLVQDKANLCWSIEGGRTRTGKLRPPRYGLLRYVADAADNTDGPEPLLVPVSMMYDQIPGAEIARMAAEARGRAKEAENVRWLVGYAAGLNERRGRIYLDFGEPLPLRSRLSELRAESVSENLVERVALDVCHRLNAATPITPTSTVCIALLAADRALSLDEVSATVRPLAEYVHGRGWPVAGAANLTDRSTLRWALKELSRSGVLIEDVGDTETVWAIGPGQHLVAAFYRNSALHVLLLRAVAELALARTAAAGGASVLEHALRLRELLKFDFFFPTRDAFLRELSREVALLADEPVDSIDAVSAEQADLWLAKASFLAAPLVLRPFVDAYRVVAAQLTDLEEQPVGDTEQFVSQALRTGRQWALRRRVASEESVSAEMFRTALKLAAHRELLTGSGRSARRGEFAREVAEVADDIARLALAQGS